MYISLERNFRGFNYTRDWNRVESFWKGMKANIEKDNDEICWAKLFNKETGDEVALYRRGQIIEEH